MSDFVRECGPGPYTQHWINLECYRISELPWFFVGCGLWAIVYGIIVYRGFKLKWVEMPTLAAAGNIAWEFVWGFIHETNMGSLAVYLYQLWFAMDVVIFYLVWRYGFKQGFPPVLQRWQRAMFVGTALAWAVLIALYQWSGHEDRWIGATTAYAVNIPLSATYLFQLAHVRDVRGMSPWVAWLKMIGTLLNTVFMFIVFPNDYFLGAMGVIVWVLDMLYIFWLRARRIEQSKDPALPALTDPSPIDVQ